MQGFPLADKTVGNPQLLHILLVLLAVGFLRLLQGTTPDGDEHAAPRQRRKNFRRVDCDAFPAVCAVTNRAVPPDPTPVGCISSAIQLHLCHHFARLPIEIQYALLPFLPLVD